MGAKRGQKPGKGGAKGATPAGRRKGAGPQRLALVVFGALFILLFVIFAIAEGLGQPSVPSGDVAMVQNIPNGEGNISEAELKRATLQQASQGGLKKLPTEGKKLEELRKTALGERIQALWIRGEAEERGITASDKEIATELANIKKQQFKTKAAFQKFLKESHFTPEEVNNQVRLKIFTTALQEDVAKGAPLPTSEEIAQFYDASKATQFTTKPTRDIRLISNKNKKKAEEAKAALDKGHTPADWKKVAAKFSSDPTSKAKGGLQEGISEEVLKEPIKAAIFKTAQGTVVGPVDYEKNFYVVEVTKLNPEKVSTLGEVRSQISSQLQQQLQQEVFNEFVAGWQSKWQARTFCASEFVMERCGNYKGTGHPTSAPPACYEANPKGGLPEACPAPVTANQPALPGSTNVLKPQGERLPQRPRPAGLKESGSEPTLPETTAPPPAE